MIIKNIFKNFKNIFLKTYLIILKTTFVLPLGTELLINRNKLFKTNLCSARVFTFLYPFSTIKL